MRKKVQGTGDQGPVAAGSMRDLVALLGSREAPADGMTTAEIARALGGSRTAAQNKIRDAVDAGLMEFCGRKKVPRMDGGTMSSPCYRLVGKGPGSRCKGPGGAA